MAQRTISTILREIDQIKRANIADALKQKFLAQKEAELTQIGNALPEPPVTLPLGANAPKPSK